MESLFLTDTPEEDHELPTCEQVMQLFVNGPSNSRIRQSASPQTYSLEELQSLCHEELQSLCEQVVFVSVDAKCSLGPEQRFYPVDVSKYHTVLSRQGCLCWFRDHDYRQSPTLNSVLSTCALSKDSRSIGMAPNYITRYLCDLEEDHSFAVEVFCELEDALAMYSASRCESTTCEFKREKAKIEAAFGLYSRWIETVEHIYDLWEAQLRDQVTELAIELYQKAGARLRTVERPSGYGYHYSLAMARIQDECQFVKLVLDSPSSIAFDVEVMLLFMEYENVMDEMRYLWQSEYLD